jgi:hypothetical protein
MLYLLKDKPVKTKNFLLPPIKRTSAMVHIISTKSFLAASAFYSLDEYISASIESN